MTNAIKSMKIIDYSGLSEEDKNDCLKEVESLRDYIKNCKDKDFKKLSKWIEKECNEIISLIKA